MKVSLQVRIISTVIAVIALLTVVSFSMFFLKLDHFSENQEIKERKNLYDSQKQELRDVVAMAYSTVKMFYDESQNVKKLKDRKYQELKKVLDAVYSQASTFYKENNGKISQNELENAIKKMIKDARYADGNYIWINDLQPSMVMHPTKSSLDGKDLSKFKDPNGTFLFNKMVEVCKKDGAGMVNYMWAKPGEDEPKGKVSYVRLLPELGWILGTGAWLEDVEEQMKKDALEQLSKLRLTDDNYFWVNDITLPVPIMLMHPMSPGLVGKALSSEKFNCTTTSQVGVEGEELTKDAGRNFVQVMVEIVTQNPAGEGYVAYEWGKSEKAGGKKGVLYPKVSYVRLFEPWGWVIGVGTYVDDIEATVAEDHAVFIEQINDILITVGAIIFVLAILVTVFFIWILNRDVNKPLGSLISYSEEVAAGDLNASLTGRFVGGLDRLKDSIQAMVKNIKEEMEQVQAKEGEATENAAKAEEAVARVQEHVSSLNNLLENVNNVVKKVHEVSESIQSTSGELADKFQEVSNGAERQKRNLDDTMNSMREMSTVVLDVAKNAGEASESSEKTKGKAEEGAEIVSEAKVAIDNVREVTDALKVSMHGLGDQAQAIGQVMNVINDIADQTNLLALNAAIEAARAGEAGRGFAVVADEVRKLAEKTMDATKEVGENIHAIQGAATDNMKKVDQASDAVERATDKADASGQTLEEIVELAVENAGQVQTIASASEEQAAATEEMSASVESVGEIASQTLEGMTESVQVTHDLNALAQEVNTIILELKDSSF